jgi:hypothetical protein
MRRSKWEGLSQTGIDECKGEQVKRRTGAGERILRARGTKVSPRWCQIRTPPEVALPDRAIFVAASGQRKAVGAAEGLHTRPDCTGMQPWPPLRL